MGKEFPDVGIWSLGYAASPTRWAKLLRLIQRGSRDSGYSMALPDRAAQVLDLMPQKGLGERPILFICHSLGGLVAKQVLRKAGDATDPRKQQVARQTRAVLFLATPHAGAELASLLSAFRTVFGSTVSIEDLREHDAHLRDLYDWYRNQTPQLRIRTVTYFELRSVKGVLPIVNPTSAHPGVGQDPVGLDEDHLSIAKPRELGAQVCGAARDLLRFDVLASPLAVPATTVSVPPAAPTVSHEVVIRLDSGTLLGSEPPSIPGKLPPASDITRIQDDVVNIALTKEGHFVGGVEALRKLSADVLNNDWSGDIQIHHAFLESVQEDIHDLLARAGLSADQAKTLERLRPQAAWIKSSIETVCLAARMTFQSAASREPTWGVPMRTEEALGFFTGLFLEARLTPSNAGSVVPCQLYVPGRVRDPLSIDLSLSESEVRSMRESWEQELMPFDDSKWQSWDWPDLVPIWHLSDQLIAARLLPAIAITMAGRVRRTPPHTKIDDAWDNLRQVYSPNERDPLVPYHWCLAVRSVRSPKDLAWLVSPLHYRTDLQTVLGFRR